MYLVGLTGGIGSGKSAVAQYLVARGAELIDADVVARKVVEPGTDGLARIVERFGASILHPDGTLDREALAAIVFSDDGARRDLEAITHPAIAAAMAERMASLGETDNVVILDAPLIVETGRGGFDCLLVVAAKDETQVDRLVRLRGMTEADARARIAAQAPLEEKLAKADIVIWNEASLEDLEQEVERVWVRIEEAARNKAAAGGPGLGAVE